MNMVARRLLIGGVSTFVVLFAPGRADAWQAGPEQLVAASAPTSAPVTDQAAMLQRGRELLRMLIEGRMEAFVASADERVKGLLDVEGLRTNWSMVEFQVGKFRSEGFATIRRSGDQWVCRFVCRFEKGVFDGRILLNDRRELSGLAFDRVESDTYYAPPEYVHLDSFREECVTVSAGAFPLPGLLCIPKTREKHAAVVIVGRMGAQDQDGTLGPNRPLRDVAWGLASKGVATLRYENRRKAYAAVPEASQWTLEEEVIQDALAAAALLRQREEVDPRRVFLLGHELGAFAAPLAARRDEKLAGLVLLAPPGRPILDWLYERREYIAKADDNVDPFERKELDELKQALELVRAGKVHDAATPLGMPASFLASVQTADPLAAAAELRAPILLLRGRRDFETNARDLEIWRERIGARPNVRIREYDKLNHYFIPGGGYPTDLEYQMEGTVQEQVLIDIAQWIRERM